MTTSFDPTAVQRFRYLPWAFDKVAGEATFHYGFDDTHLFTETFVFPSAHELDEPRLAALHEGLGLLSLAVGISYYKAAAPPTVVFESGPVAEDVIAFLSDLYGNGLAEFRYVNDRPIDELPRFEFVAASTQNALPLGLSPTALVAVGGGKDSCVSIDVASRVSTAVLLASVDHSTGGKPGPPSGETARPIAEVMAVTGLPSAHVRRTISPDLRRLNSVGALNGHVPVTAVVSMTLVCLAIILDCRDVVMSNERSASAPTRQRDGHAVNHQHSKSLAVEIALAALVRRHVAADLSYFSLLRPLSELAITKRFAGLSQFHGVFTSCSRAFYVEADRRVERWCNDCPKCRFVFLALAPFMRREALARIFGHDLLDDTAQQSGFDALIGWHAEKPFECVGEIEESLVAFVLLAEQHEWRDAVVVKRIAADVLPTASPTSGDIERVLAPVDAHQVPPHYLEALLCD